jgi:hypothetical protein
MPNPDRSKPKKNWTVNANHIKKTNRNKNTIQYIFGKQLIRDQDCDPDGPDVIMKSTQFHYYLRKKSNLHGAKEDIFFFNTKVKNS